MDLSKIKPKIIYRLLDCFDGYGLVITDDDLINNRISELDFEGIFNEDSEFNEYWDKKDKEREITDSEEE